MRAVRLTCLLALMQPYFAANAAITLTPQILDVPFIVTQPVVALDLLPSAGKELIVLGVDQLKQAQLAVYQWQGDNYQLFSQLPLPTGSYQYDFTQVQAQTLAPTAITPASFFVASSRAIYQLRWVEDGKDESLAFEQIHQYQGLPVSGQTHLFSRGQFVYQLDQNPAPELLLQTIQGMQLLSNVSQGQIAQQQSLPISSDGLQSNGELRFIPARLYPADVNFDQRLDLLHIGERDIAVYQQQANGQFAAYPSYLTFAKAINGLPWWRQRDEWGNQLDQGSMSYRYLQEIKDVNGDQLPDLLVRYTKSSGVLDKENAYEIYYGQRSAEKTDQLEFNPVAETRLQGDSILRAFRTIAAPTGDHILISGFELGLSQAVSALLAGEVDEEIQIYSQQQNKQFKQQLTTEVPLTFSLSSGDRGTAVIASGDLNGDQTQDLILGQGTQALAVYQGLGATGFADKPQLIKLSEPLSQAGEGVQIQDLNHDGYDDLLLHYTRQDPKNKHQQVVIYLNQKL